MEQISGFSSNKSIVKHPRMATRGDLAAVEAVVRAAYLHYVDRMGREPGPMGDDYGP